MVYCCIVWRYSALEHLEVKIILSDCMKAHLLKDLRPEHTDGGALYYSDPPSREFLMYRPPFGSLSRGLYLL